ncbi:MAG TPA: DUF1343 domain-containing protein [Candidatus Dormibacteraeota bacterium]|nr:DUF1343 domain-containing protein [Candidatus Dormibacteraeota bacterium]
MQCRQFSIVLFFLSALLSYSDSAFCATAKTAAKTSAKKSRPGRVQTGLDVLESQKFAPLKGKHVGLITNHTGLDAQEKTTIDRLAHAPGVTLVALFSPEHGLAGKMDDKVSSTKDPSTGLPVYSLYGENKRPTDEMLEGIDALVFDIQDAGVRFYTYTTTMGYCMEAAAKKGIAFYVLDRPNPIGGEIVEGPMLDDDKRAFVAYFPTPVRYGLTIGELAQLYNAENKIGVELHVIQMKNWHRNYFYESTGLRWVPPSPNLRTTKGAILYPGLEILQNAGVSVGRGTETPFEIFGAPWMNGEDVASALNAKHLLGLKFVSQLLIPVSGLYAGQRCGGVSIRIGEKSAVRSMRMGLEIAAALKKLYPDKVDLAKTITLLGNATTVQLLQDGVPPEKIVADWKDDLAAFDKTRRKYMLYK